MTGYGKAVCQLENKQITIEIKTLNSRNADMFFKAPGYFREKEMDIRHLLAKKFIRGKIECFITESYEQQQTDVKINQAIIQDYLSQLKPILQQENLEINTDVFRTIFGMPNVYTEKSFDFSEQSWQQFQDAFNHAINDVQNHRLAEGKVTETNILSNLFILKEKSNEVSKFEQGRIDVIVDRWRKNLTQLKIDVDENRFEQEIVFFLDKLDISEEKVRLSNHIDYFQSIVNEPGIEKGKKLAFILQEMNREINTLGSKANEVNIQKLVVEMKDSLEKIREQLGNIL